MRRSRRPGPLTLAEPLAPSERPGHRTAVPLPESILVDALLALDAALARDRPSQEIAAREERLPDGRVVHSKMIFDTHDPALYAVCVRILGRHRIDMVREPRQGETTISIFAPSVFLNECLAPELMKLMQTLDQFFRACVERTVEGLFVDGLPVEESRSEFELTTPRPRSAARRKR